MRTASLIVYVALGGCSGGPDYQPPVYIPLLIYPRPLMVTEGESTTFVLSTSDFSHGDPRGAFHPNNDKLTVTPSTFDLSPSSSSATITMTAATDADSMNEGNTMSLYIYGALGGESPGMGVLVVDTNAQNAIASNWNVTMSPASTAVVDVRLTQPPGAPVTVTLQSSNPGVANVTPTTLVFGAADYNVSQTATVTSSGTGTALVALSSTLPATAIFVSVQ